MKTTIKGISDIRKGDLFLGLEVKDEPMGFLNLGGITLQPCEVSILVHAGNKTVERKPKKVEFVTVVHPVGNWAGGAAIGRICEEDFSLGGFVGSRVKVIIEPI